MADDGTTSGAGDGAPEHLDLARARDLRGRRAKPWIRRVGLALMAIPVVLVLGGVAGQQSSTGRSAAPAGALELTAPEALRGGLLWPARIEVRAARTIQHPRLILGTGWVRGMQLNQVEPQPSGEAGRNDGRLVLSYDQLAAGDRLVVFLQAQVDPTTVGREDLSVELDDATTPVARVRRTITVLP